MATLSKRANKLQRIALRVVDGSIRCAMNAHPEIQLTPQQRASISKRAAGTLVSLYKTTLAGKD